MLRVFAIVISLAIGTAAGWLVRSYLTEGGPASSAATGSTARPSSADAAGASAARRAIIALGTLQPKGGIVHVASPMAGYRIDSIHAREGLEVTAGDVLVELDRATAETERELAKARLADAEQAQSAQIDLAREALATARLALEQVQQGRTTELAAQQALVRVADAKRRQVELDLGRLEEMRQLPEPLAGQYQVDQQRVLLEAAEAEWHAAQQAERRLEQSLDFRQQTAEAELRAAERSLQIAERGAGVEALRRGVELAELQLAQTTVIAPIDGVIVGVSAREGEVVSVQPLLQLANLNQMVCEVEVDAADMRLLQRQHPAIVRCRAVPGAELPGVVEHVGTVVARAALQPLDPRQPLNRHVVKVVVALDSQKLNEVSASASNQVRLALIGLQVEVEFPLSDEQPVAAQGSEQTSDP